MAVTTYPATDVFPGTLSFPGSMVPAVPDWWPPAVSGPFVEPLVLVEGPFTEGVATS